MKFNLLFLIASLLACLVHCKKGNQPIVDIPDDPVDTVVVNPPVDSHIIELGKVSVLKDGQLWNVPFQAEFFHSDSAMIIWASHLNYNNGIEETFGISDIPCKSGKYVIEYWPTQATLYPNQIPQGSYGLLYDGDQPIGSFLLDTTKVESYVEVLQYDSTTHIAEGRFQFFTKKRKPVGLIYPGVPDSIAFTEGKFRLEVK